MTWIIDGCRRMNDPHRYWHQSETTVIAGKSIDGYLERFSFARFLGHVPRRQVSYTTHSHASTMAASFYSGDYVGAVVADLGYHDTKIGWAGNDYPRSYFRSVRMSLYIQD